MCMYVCVCVCVCVQESVYQVLKRCGELAMDRRMAKAAKDSLDLSASNNFMDFLQTLSSTPRSGIGVRVVENRGIEIGNGNWELRLRIGLHRKHTNVEILSSLTQSLAHSLTPSL